MCTTYTRSQTDTQPQYDSILQSYNIEINKLFALSGHETSKRMEDSAKRMEIVTRQTARDSASMHVITFLTMIFLPGTFLGVRLMTSRLKSSSGSLTSDQTFFSTPVLDGEGQAWSINYNLLWLFLEICGPMMVIILVGWYRYMLWFKRNRMEHRLMASDGEDMV